MSNIFNNSLSHSEYDIEKHRPRCIRHVGYMKFSFCKVPYQPRIDGTECKLSLFASWRDLDIVKYPIYFGSGEISVYYKSRLLKYSLALPFS